MKHDLKTGRLRLEPCRLKYVLSIHKLWTNQHVRHFLFDEREISLDETRSVIEVSLKNFEQRNYGLWLVFESNGGRVIGFAGLLPSDAEDTPNRLCKNYSDTVAEFILVQINSIESEKI